MFDVFVEWMDGRDENEEADDEHDDGFEEITEGKGDQLNGIPAYLAACLPVRLCRHTT